MAIWKMVVLGLVQGLTEFLPVSSSGHLLLFEKILNVDLEGGGMSAMFLGLMLHLGTLISLVIAFWRDILDLFRKPFHTLLFLLAASVPAAIVGLCFGDEIDAFFASGKYLCWCFLFTAVLLLATEFVTKRIREPKEMNLWRALAMGAAQAVAVVPGISRSGSTIAAGTLSGAERGKAARFSFLMSAPVIAGGALLEIVDFARSGSPVSGGTVAAVLVGMAVAAASGYFAIRVMLRLVSKANYKWFALYLLLLSVFTFVNNFTGWIG